MDAFYLPFGGLKIKPNGDLVWLEWQPGDLGVAQNLLAQLSPPERERIEEEWRILREQMAAFIAQRLEDEKAG